MTVTKIPTCTSGFRAWRIYYQNKWRVFSASGDATVIMWNVMGTDIRMECVADSDQEHVNEI